MKGSIVDVRDHKVGSQTEYEVLIFNYNFIGAGSMIGLRSGKVIAYGTRTKRCAVCEAATRDGSTPRLHDCRLNWSGSSKAMEPDVGAQLAKTCAASKVWC